MPNTITPIARGLRERKKLKTKEAIQREALRLFQEQGYDETTIEQIAEAVEISPSTFFNYFPTKEDVVIQDPYDPLFISSFLGQLLHALNKRLEFSLKHIEIRMMLLKQISQPI